jgi:endonuclease-3
MSPARSSIPETGTPGAAGARKTAGTGRRKTLRKSPGKAPAAGRKTGTKATKSSTSARLQPEPLLRARARKIVSGLKRAYPGAHCALHFRSPLELYVATVLSAQCTDERVNQVTPALFARCQRPEDYLALGQDRLEEAIRPTGFYRNKTKSILAGCRVMLERFAGKVPGTMEELVQIPGAGRKTANVILGNAFDTPGITVDTHVGRVSRRLELTAEEDPVKVEFALQKLIPRKDWTWFSHAMIQHGRVCCQARRPWCEGCPLAAWCPYPAKAGARPAGRKGKSRT